MENRLIASSSPHIRSEETVSRIMLDVIIALLPAVVASIFYFGFNSLILTLLSVASAVATEYACQKVMKRNITINDLSAVVTGILVAFNMPSTAPWWMAVIGSVFAIAIAKQVFGGLGFNFINPALAGRAFIMASWMPHMTSGFVDPAAGAVDAISSATPLALLKAGEISALPSMFDMFIGRIPGCLGETSSVLLILGGLYLIYRGVITWKIPVFYIGTVVVIAIFTNGIQMVPYHLFGGGLMLGAFFMATDYATSPVTPNGQIIYAVGAGVLTMLIRTIGGYPEGVSYSILLMNVAAPLIDKYTSPKLFGGAKK